MADVASRPAAIKAIPVRHPGRWLSAFAVVAIGTYFVGTVVSSVARDPTKEGHGWDTVAHYFLSPLIVRGVLLTLVYTVLAMVIGITLGVVLAVMRLSPNWLMAWVSWLYIWFFRGTPVLVQIFFWFNLNILISHIGIGVPFTSFWIQADTNSLITPFVAVLLGLGLNEAAYMAEIVRAGIISVEHGQTEAALALGMDRILLMRRVVLPQAMRVIIPPTGNETISMLKTSSLAYIATGNELFTRTEQIATATYAVIEMLIVASIWYLLLTSVLTVGQFYIERYFGRGSHKELPPTPLQRFKRMLVTFHAPPPVPAGPPLSVGSEHR